MKVKPQDRETRSQGVEYIRFHVHQQKLAFTFDFECVVNRPEGVWPCKHTWVQRKVMQIIARQGGAVQWHCISSSRVAVSQHRWCAFRMWRRGDSAGPTFVSLGWWSFGRRSEKKTCSFSSPLIGWGAYIIAAASPVDLNFTGLDQAFKKNIHYKAIFGPSSFVNTFQLLHVRVYCPVGSSVGF